jgi:hypothetical protein
MARLCALLVLVVTGVPETAPRLLGRRAGAAKATGVDLRRAISGDFRLALGTCGGSR